MTMLDIWIASLWIGFLLCVFWPPSGNLPSGLFWIFCWAMLGSILDWGGVL
jgi:hypothetical protein